MGAQHSTLPHSRVFLALAAPRLPISRGLRGLGDVMSPEVSLSCPGGPLCWKRLHLAHRNFHHNLISGPSCSPTSIRLFPFKLGQSGCGKQLGIPCPGHVRPSPFDFFWVTRSIRLLTGMDRRSLKYRILTNDLAEVLAAANPVFPIEEGSVTRCLGLARHQLCCLHARHAYMIQLRKHTGPSTYKSMYAEVMS
jgi:hypothetical protein